MITAVALVNLDSGATISAERILSVERLNTTGECVSAWHVGDHDLDGEKGERRRMHSASDQWLLRYRRIRELTESLTRHDPRFKAILALIDQCDTHYAKRDDDGFIAVGKRIASLMAMPGAQQNAPIPAQSTEAV